MCGIHGFINGKTKPEINTDDFIKSGFITNMLRGTDSSGIGVVDTTGFADVAKLPMAGLYLPAHKPAAALISRARRTNTASICHVRAATQGDITWANAHPFFISADDDSEDIVGCHNGTLTNWRTKKEGNRWDVDSAWALSRILSEGVDAFEEFSGAFAFVWWKSADPGKLHMARNNQRPLFIAYTEDDNLVYASEAGMIHWLCERHRIKLKGNIKELEADHMYSFDIADPTKYVKSTKLPAPKVTTTTTSNYGSNVMGGWDDRGGKPYHDYRKTTCEKLDEIFKTVAPTNTTKTSTQLTLVPTETKKKSNSSVADADEMQNAHDLNLLGCRGTFTAIGSDDEFGNIYGSFESDTCNGEMHAVMRDSPIGLDWSSGSSWDVKIEGVKDTDSEFLMVVSHPLTVAA